MSRCSSLLKPGHRAGRRLTGAATLALALGALTAAPAVAQTTETETPSDSSSPGASGFDLDLGDVVQTDEDGNVTWNVETDTGLAEPDSEAPAADPASGIAGTGTSEDVGGGAGTESDTGDGGRERSPLETGDAAGAGNTMAMVLGIAGVAVVAVVGTMLFLRARKERQGADARIEEVIDPAEPLAGDFEAVAAETPYDGAVDGGAYEAGGAAYAQYTNEPHHNVGTATAAAAGASTGDESAHESRFDQLRSQVVGLADKGLADSGHDRLVAKKLEAAGSKMRPGEWLVLGIGGSVGAFFGISFLLGWLLGAAAGVLVAFGFWMWLDYMAGKRQKAFAEDLPETLGLIAGSLRGGLSMMQAIQTVADEADDPTAGEFQRLVTETRLGRDLAVSFRDLSQRMASQDFEWVVTAIEIHREVGGDLASILDRVGNTIRQRNRVRGQVKALSAEGRVSGLILFLLPLVMVGAISVMNRAYLNEMLNETAGQIMLIIAGVLLLVGGVWLKRLSRFIY